MALAVFLRTGCRSAGALKQLRTASVVPIVAPRNLVTASQAPKTAVSSLLVAPNRKIATTSTRLHGDEGGHGGNHVTLWTAERALSLALLGVVPVALAFPSQAADAALAVSIVMHQHWGLEAIVTDYVRPIIFGNTVPKVAHGVLLLFSAATLGGLFYFIYNDIGIGNAVRKFWALKSKE